MFKVGTPIKDSWGRMLVIPKVEEVQYLDRTDDDSPSGDLTSDSTDYIMFDEKDF